MEEMKFRKENIANSNMYREYKDILNVILDENEEYTLDEVDALICEFLEREVE